MSFLRDELSGLVLMSTSMNLIPELIHLLNSRSFLLESGCSRSANISKTSLERAMFYDFREKVLTTCIFKSN